MRSFSYALNNTQQLQQSFNRDRLLEIASESSALLIQIYSGNIDPKHCQSTAQFLREVFPQAVIVGVTTAGEIRHGEAQSLSTQISISAFEKTELSLLRIEADDVGHESLNETISAHKSHTTRSALLLTTPLTLDSDQLSRQVSLALPTATLMGGGAGDNGGMQTAYVFDDKQCSNQQALLVLMHSEHLKIFPHAHLYWQPIGKKMVITKADKRTIYSIDDQPAIEVYQRYLGLGRKPEEFFLETLEFPLLIHRGDNLLARVPVSFNDDGSLNFISDVQTGDLIQLGFGNVDRICQQATRLPTIFSELKIETFFVFSCGCRRFFLQDEVSIESLPLNDLAHTCGFFSVGEFYRNSQSDEVLNLTFTAYGLTEQKTNISRDKATEQFTAATIRNLDEQQVEITESADLYDSKYLRVLGKLTQFLNATTLELQQALTAANSANHAKMRFLAGISHEIRTPMTTVIGYAEAIAKRQLSEDEIQDAAHSIVRNGTHVNALINDILDFSRLDAAKVKLQRDTIDLPVFIQDLLHTVAPLISDKPIELLHKTHFPLPQFIHTDALRLRQLLLNILNNAAKFTERGSITLTLEYSLNQLRFSIEDTGVGIATEHLEQLFQPFEQIHAHINHQYGGTGLGLSISRQLARLLGGDISVHSQLGQGSRFTCPIDVNSAGTETLSSSTQWQQALTLSQHSASLAAATSAQSYSLNILVAEDQPENRQLFQRILEALGCLVSVAENGRQAVKLAKEKTFDLILMDIQMPVMGGIEALQTLQQEKINTPVVALTANALREDIERYRSQGFSDCLAKPLRQKNLTQLLDRLSQGAQGNTQPDRGPVHAAVVDDINQRYQASLPNVLKQLEQAHTAGDHTELGAQAHSLRGSAAHFNHEPLEDLAKLIELGIQQERHELISHALEQFQQYLLSLKP